MDERQIEQSNEEEHGVLMPCGRRHCVDQPKQDAGGCDGHADKSPAVLGVKAVPAMQRHAWRWTISIKEAIGDVDQPCPEREQQRRVPGKFDPHDAGEKPRPKGRNGGGVQTQQMPGLQ